MSRFKQALVAKVTAWVRQSVTTIMTETWTYVTNFGHNILYRNNGDRTFTDVTSDAGVNDFRLSTGAAFIDYDNDRDLDLFVLSYVDFANEGTQNCWDSLGTRDYCLPAQYKPLPARLFRNEGSGRFVDVTQQSGIGSATGAGLGVTCPDYDADGWIDLYVANDGTPDLLWMNKGDGTFEEKGLLAGAAYNENALVSAGMGVTAGDFDNDGDRDLFVTNLTGETNTLYVNDGMASFHDASRKFKLAIPSFPYTGSERVVRLRQRWQPRPLFSNGSRPDRRVAARNALSLPSEEPTLSKRRKSWFCRGDQPRGPSFGTV